MTFSSAKRYFFLVLIIGLLWGLLWGAAAPADISNFKVRQEVDTSGTPGSMVVTGDDRFVLMLNTLDSSSVELSILDTWNFSLVAGDLVMLKDGAHDLAISPKNPWLYYTRNDGTFTRIDITDLSGLPIDAELVEGTTLFPTQADLDDVGTPLWDIEVISENNTSVDCVFIVSGENDNFDLLYYIFSTNGQQISRFGTVYSGAQEIELTSGKGVVFARIYDLTALIYDYTCNATDVTQQPFDNTLFGTHDMKGISTNPNGNRLLIGDNESIRIIDTSYLPAPNVAGSDTVVAGVNPDRVLYTDFPPEPNPIAWVAGDTTKLIGANLDPSQVLFSGQPVTAINNLTQNPLDLISSSYDDGYIYFSDAKPGSVSVFTANPWISNLNVTAGSTTESCTLPTSTTGCCSSHGNVTGCQANCKVSCQDGWTLSTCACTKTTASNELSVSFHAEAATNTSTYGIYKRNYFSGSKVKLVDGTIDKASADVQAKVNAKDLDTGNNTLTIVVQDTGGTGRKGRMGISTSAEKPPSAVKFTLNFGDQKIIIDFTALDREDVTEYDIYYGTNCSGPQGGYTLLDNNTVDQGSPASPVPINNPTAKQSIEKVIMGLTNDVEYCAQIVTHFSAQSIITISDRKYTTPQKVRSLTDQTHEKGGLNCLLNLGPHAQGSPRDLWCLFLPLAAVLFIRLARRKR